MDDRALWSRIEEIFHSALEREGAERADYLRTSCEGDEDLRRRVESLLAQDDSGSSLGALAGHRLGPYEILAPLGAGGMGEVYRARDTRLNRTVAVKVLRRHLSDNPRFRERFEREAHAIASLSHPHICTLHDVGHQNEIDYLVMEYLEGQTLADRLRKGPLPLDQVLQYAIEISGALNAAHRRGVIHRDLKPGNVMLTKSGVKLLDFGLAKLEDRAATAIAGSMAGVTAPLSGEGTLLGTLQYMAPEQLDGKGADARTDIFAFGAVTYEMVTGKKVFEGESQATLASAITTQEPASMSAVQPLIPPALDRIVRTCLAKLPDERWQHAGDLTRELRWLRGEAGGSSNAQPTFRNRERFAWALVAVACMAAIILAIVHLRQPVRELPPMRFSVSAPENMTLVKDEPFALSPDGGKLAMIQAVPGDTPSLWVRRLDNLTVQPLPGTEDVSDPFWSPDSQFIGFFAKGKLKTIAISGGPPQELCSVPKSYYAGAGTWTSTGTILFSIESGLQRVAASGGQPTTVTQVEEGQEINHTFPYFLPDGRHYLYLVRRKERKDDGIYVGSLDSKDRKLLLTSHLKAEYARDKFGQGYILFLRDGTLMAQRFDPKNVQLAGEPRALAEIVRPSGPPYLRFPLFTASANGILCYRLVDETSELVWLDRNGNRLGTVPVSGEISDARISPDGTQLALQRKEIQSEDTGIWRYDMERVAMTRLTFGPVAGIPIWSPDGQRIIYTSIRNDRQGLYAKLASGEGNEELIFLGDKSSQVGATDCSRDGRFVLFQTVQAGPTKADVWLLPMRGDRKPVSFLQTEFAEFDARLSPDGKWITYTSNESGRFEIYVRRFTAGAAGGAKWMISTHGGRWPAWRGDGKEMFYFGLDGKIMAVPVSARGESTNTTFVPGVPKALFDTGKWQCPEATPFIPAADGQRFLVIALTDDKPQSVNVVIDWAATP